MHPTMAFHKSTLHKMPFLLILIIYNLVLSGHVSSQTTTEEIQVHLQMREETPPFTRIGSVASSLPTSLGTKLHFLTDSTFFSVTPTQGEIRVARLIDRERLCPEFKLCCGVLICQLDARVFVTNKVTGEFAASLVVKVDIQDQNDNRPLFATPNQKVSVSENAVVGTHISLVPATDADIDSSNQIQRYTLIEPAGAFVLDSSQLPAIRLQLTRALDRERTRAYTATLEACDPGACARQTVDIDVLDENDNRPIFQTTRLKERLMENMRVGQVVLRLNATDADSGERGRVVYSLHGTVDADLMDTFELVQDTGEVRLKRPLQANIRDNYHFKVIACDAINPACSTGEQGQVDITFMVEDINNFAPTIHAVAAGLVVSDAEDRLNADGTKTSSLSSTDGLSIPENTPPSQVAVLTVRDADVGENARVTCSLNDTPSGLMTSSASPEFILTPSAPGIYSLRTARVFDHEVTPQVSAKVVCHDYGSPQQLTSARLITVKVVDVNEFQPEFSRRVYVGRVPENAAAGLKVLTTTATDRDRGAVLRYAFAPPPQSTLTGHSKGTNWAKENGQNRDDLNAAQMGVNRFFVIDSDSGIIRTSQIPLDRETVDSVSLIVVVTDSTLSPVFTATTTVSIEVLDENDNAPVFLNPPATVALEQVGHPRGGRNPLKSFTVMENAPRFTRMSEQLEARDPDQGDNGRVHFTLLDTYALTRPSHIPRGLSRPSVPPIGSVSGKTNEDAIDELINEMGLSKRVVDQALFRITPDNGIETLVELDRESVPIYLLKIGAQDRGAQPLASTVLLRVDVLDANDNAPIWVFPTPTDRTINLTTAMRPGSLAGRLRAEDTDAGDAGRVDYLFLGPRGEPLTAVSLRDGLLNSLNPPQNSDGTIRGNSVAGGVVPVQNLDHRTNQLENGYRVGPLYLNGSTGEIWIAQPLSSGSINLHLRGQDRGAPGSQTDAWMTIHVFADPNDDPGFFNFGTDGTLNVTIILIMITITAIVSLFLIVGIVCVRRRPVRLTNTVQGGAQGLDNGLDINGVTAYPIDTTKDGMGTTLTTGSWPSPLGLYTPGQYYTTQGSMGSPVMEDGQLFATLGSPGMMGYGAMVAASDNASLIYVPQTQHQQQAQHQQSGGMMPGSMTPVHLEHGMMPMEYTNAIPGGGQMHTFGTLTRARGSLTGGFYSGSTSCGGGGGAGSYEPHLDADSGDSGRGPSEEGNQFLLSDNYRNGMNPSASVGAHAYNTYAGYRPSSRTGYYRPGMSVDAPSSSGIKMHAMNCSGNACACYLLPTPTMVYPDAQPIDMVDYTGMYRHPNSIDVMNGGELVQPSSPMLHRAPSPPPRSPLLPASDVIVTRKPARLGRNSLNVNGEPKDFQLRSVGSTDPNYATSDHQSTPLRIDLRGAGDLQPIDAMDMIEDEEKLHRRPITNGMGMGPGLPPLANPKINSSTLCSGQQ